MQRNAICLIQFSLVQELESKNLAQVINRFPFDSKIY